MKLNKLFFFKYIMSVNNGNIKLEIKVGDGISQAIDRKLDADFKQDIKLNRVEWNTIFEIVKQDQTVINKQYTGDDTDIGNSSHYIVQKGFYELTQNAWNQIKNLVNEKLGKQAVVAEDISISEEIAEQSKEETPEEAVVRILNERKVNVDETTIKLVVAKYPTMKEISTAGLTIEDRVVNYAKGLQFDRFGYESALGKDGEYDSDCSKAKTLDELKTSYKQFGAEYVEIYDKDNDGKINCYEMFYRELLANYKSNGFSDNDAQSAAIKAVDEYVKLGYSVSKLPTEETFESILFGEVVNKILTLDYFSNETPDFAISANEAGAHLMSMAKMCDEKNNITSSEYNNTVFALMYSGYTLEEIMQERNCSQDVAQKIINAVQQYETGLKAYMPWINT